MVTEKLAGGGAGGQVDGSPNGQGAGRRVAAAAVGGRRGLAGRGRGARAAGLKLTGVPQSPHRYQVLISTWRWERDR